MKYKTVKQNLNLAVIGLGYVGLPLSVAFGKKMQVKGFDSNENRINELMQGIDITNECSKEDIKKAQFLKFTSDSAEIEDCNCYIVTVPTPIDKLNKPDLEPLMSASKTVGSILKLGDIVIYESTVYPGATEEICVPILERISGLVFNKDFFCGYSPERINPGDKEHRLENIIKVISGSDKNTTEVIDNLYNQIIDAGTHVAESIKVAEAAKVIENTQRDLNIALINELAMIFDRLNIDTNSVLEAAGSKWNFLNFKPGLVGGHCIGVDPYYLTHKSEQAGYHPEVILAGRKVNDNMHNFISTKLINYLQKQNKKLNECKVLVMGITFKENCPDIRNTKVIPLIERLTKNNLNVEVYDPWISSSTTKILSNIKFINSPEADQYDAIIFAVAHKEFINIPSDKLIKMKKKDGVIFDLKHIIPRDLAELRL